MWPGRPGVTRVFPQAIWESGALPGRARWRARSAQRPSWAGARARAGGAGASQGKSTRCSSCRSPSTGSNTGSGTAFAAIPRASWRDVRSPSGDRATEMTAGPAARHSGRPPPGCRSRCFAASWPGPCGRRPRCRATARGPIPRAPSAARPTRTKSTSCGTAQSGKMQEGHAARGSATRRRRSPTWDRQTIGHRA